MAMAQVSIYVAVTHQTSQAPDIWITKTDGRALCQTGVKFSPNPLVSAKNNQVEEITIS